MPEIFFSCHCGLTLKVYGDDRVGSEVTCPACNASVTVPSIGEEKVKPPDPVESVPASGHGKALVIAYLSATAILTVGLVKYPLLPALERPAGVALKSVEMAAEGDTIVRIEVNEPRDMIAAMRVRKR